MLKKAITLITLISFTIYLYGCSHSLGIKKDQVEEYKDWEIAGVVTTEGKQYEFEKYPQVQIGDSLLVGFVKLPLSFEKKSYTLKEIKIPITQIQTVYVEKYDKVKSCLAVIGITLGVAAIVVLIALATKESCPFIYSFDGEKYVFDGEPYGGAICPALERTDYCLLENLKPFNNQYLLQLTNEVDETQFNNEFKLWIIDYPGNLKIIPDINGKFYSVENPFQPYSATQNGRDVLKWVDTKDQISLESDVLKVDTTPIGSVRDTIYLKFPKPSDAQRVKLLVNVGTTLWGSQMLKRMTELRGEQVDSWYKSLENPIVKAQLDYWNDREELYQLQVKVNVGGKWINRGEIWGGGPFITEDRVVSLDLSEVDSDTLNIMLTPPKGFWSFNYFATDYSEEQPFEFQEISAAEIVSDAGVDLKLVLESSDNSYYEMPNVGQRAYLKFPVPELKTGMERSVFAKVSGYYDIHMNKIGKPEYDLIQRIAFEPDFPVKYSLQEFAKWISEVKKGNVSNY